ncbi:MAG: hypothetical protein PHT40_03415, partial [Patescibacteria group bacterium]|nr:hypothetical protein [Patescibacteria group bacterium]
MLKKNILILVIALSLALLIVAPVLVIPEKTLAQVVITPIPVPTTELNSVSTEKQTILQKVWDGIKATLKTTTAVAYKNAVKYLFNKVAYDFAVKLSTGNKGQQPLFID